MATREDLDKRYPPRTKFRIRDDARGMDATEFVARYGELKARVDAPEGKSDARDTDAEGKGRKIA